MAILQEALGILKIHLTANDRSKKRDYSKKPCLPFCIHLQDNKSHALFKPTLWDLSFCTKKTVKSKGKDNAKNCWFENVLNKFPPWTVERMLSLSVVSNEKAFISTLKNSKNIQTKALTPKLCVDTSYEVEMRSFFKRSCIAMIFKKNSLSGLRC